MNRSSYRNILQRQVVVVFAIFALLVIPKVTCDETEGWSVATGDCDSSLNEEHGLEKKIFKAIQECISRSKNCCFEEVRKDVTVGFLAGAVWSSGDFSIGIRFIKGKKTLFAQATVPQDFSLCKNRKDSLEFTPDCMSKRLDVTGTIASRIKKADGLICSTPTPIPSLPPGEEKDASGAPAWPVILAAVVSSATTGIFLLVSTLVSRRRGWLCFSPSEESNESELPTEADLNASYGWEA